MNDVEAYAQLSDWKPSEFAGFKVGDLGDIQTLGRVEVVELLPPSELRVRTASGSVCRVGWRACKRVS